MDNTFKMKSEYCLFDKKVRSKDFVGSMIYENTNI